MNGLRADILAGFDVRHAVTAVLLLMLVGPAPSGAAEPLPPAEERPAAFDERFAIPLRPSLPAVAPALAMRPPTAPPSLTPSSLAPAPELQAPLPLSRPSLTGSTCDGRLGEVAVISVLSRLSGPGLCGAEDVVRLQAVKLAGGDTVTVNPPATLRCEFAEAIAHWVRDDLAPAASRLGSRLTGIVNYDSYSCRGRNRIIGAKLSEHGRANALDIRALKLASGEQIEPTDPRVEKSFRDAMRRTACNRFSTVLGPGSDGYHESHIHLDLAERRSGYRSCHWLVYDTTVAAVPLPLSRPFASK